MYKCYCGEICSVITTYRIDEINSIIKTIQMKKCSRIVGENTKKKPCDYYEENILKESIHEYPKSKYTLRKTKKCLAKKVTYRDIYILVNELLKFYDVPGINFFGKLNNYLKILNYDIHSPGSETLEELKKRLSKPPTKQVNNIYVNIEAFLSKSIVDNEYNYDIEVEQFKNIKSKINPLNWVESDLVKEILIKPGINKSKKITTTTTTTITKDKINKSIQKSNGSSVSNIDKLNKLALLEDKNDKELTLCIDKKSKSKIEEGEEEIKKTYKLKEDCDNLDDDDNDNDDEDNNLKDNEFDIDIYSDGDDCKDDNYDDFSD